MCRVEMAERSNNLIDIEVRIQWYLALYLLALRILATCEGILTNIAPSLNSAYVIYLQQVSPHSHKDSAIGRGSRTVANSILFPKDTATRSPFFTPIPAKPRASELLF